MGFRSWYLQIISPVSPLTAFGLCVYKHCEHFFPLAASMGLPSYRFVCFPLLTQIIWRGFHTNIYQLFHVISTQTQGHFCICCGCEESTTKELKGSHSDSGLWLCWKASPTTGQALVTIATFKAELYIFLSCLAISVFHSSTALWWIPSGLSNLLQFNFSICSITSFLIFLSGKKKKIVLALAPVTSMRGLQTQKQVESRDLWSPCCLGWNRALSTDLGFSFCKMVWHSTRHL